MDGQTDDRMRQPAQSLNNVKVFNRSSEANEGRKQKAKT